ncbi:TetR/AcrR family transcriptional regulator [Erythrobacter sp. WG]|uniref:TetR/AcrR family transcriptional regulator n=1 Tax=Erythrobacter sp. WG TaxID=2985510 RepID=UPI00226E3F44|nr:TetR/AcrR family transcriptional regulator [Erythrobacter sp. WG]MCX9148029.1 TetR/AcrR family transcriptional regulator [Erythrobacter sp. WG]
MSKESLLPLLMAHVLEHGMGQASLRPLAKAAGTSDRMLIYHFGTKEGLLKDLLGHIAGTYALLLDAAIAGSAPPATRSELLARILAQFGDPAMEPFMRLWWEIVGGSARGSPGFRAAAQAMVDKLVVWLEAQMPAGDPDPAGGARFLLAAIEGTAMLAAVGHLETAQQGLLAGGLLPS